MAKLANAKDLKSFGSNPLGVQFPLSAPIFKPHKKQEEFFNSKEPRIIFFGTPYGKSSWIKRYFMDERELCKQVEPISRPSNQGCATTGSEEKLVIYYDTTINLQQTKVHYTRQGTIELSQGKSKVTVDRVELVKIIDLASKLKNHEALEQVYTLNNKAKHLEHLRAQVKALEAQK